MVHRAAVDSRLLTNVLSQQKDYSKQLAALLLQSHSSVTAFSAYAAASSPPTSNVILAVATSLANADDALRRYAASVEECSAHLKALKALEDEVGNILRDREILVTRLLKASKSSNNRLSLTLHPTPSLTSLTTTTTSSAPGVLPGSFQPSTSSLSPSPALPTSQKLSAAQAELQACEAHLVLKERALAARRAGAFREGMLVRCRALVETGWVWGEVGKEALRVLEELPLVDDAGPSNTTTLDLGGAPAARAAAAAPPPPPPGRPSSDVSSLAPSQSASQVGPGAGAVAAVIRVPPAHAIREGGGGALGYGHLYLGEEEKEEGGVQRRVGLARRGSRITEGGLPGGAARREDPPPVAAPPPPAADAQPQPQPPATQHRNEQPDEDEDGSESSSTESTTDPAQLQVVENRRFAGVSAPLTALPLPLPAPLPALAPAPTPTQLQLQLHGTDPQGQPQPASASRTSNTDTATRSPATVGKWGGGGGGDRPGGFFGSLGRSLFGGRRRSKRRRGKRDMGVGGMEGSSSGSDEDEGKSRGGIMGMFHHSRTDRDIAVAAFGKGRQGYHRRGGGSVDRGSFAVGGGVKDRDDVWEVLGGAGGGRPAGGATGGSDVGPGVGGPARGKGFKGVGGQRKRVASDVGFCMPPPPPVRVVGLGGAMPALAEPSPGQGGRKLKKRSPSMSAGAVQVPDDDGQERGEEGGGGGGAVKRSKSTKSVRRSSSVPPSSGSSVTVKAGFPAGGIPTMATATVATNKASSAQTRTPAPAPVPGAVGDQITTHHAGGAVLVTGGPASASGLGTGTSSSAGAGAGANLSRNSSLMSTASAPPLVVMSARGAQGVGRGHHPHPHHPPGRGQAPVKRSASVNVSGTYTGRVQRQPQKQQQQEQQQKGIQKSQPLVIPTAPPPASALMALEKTMNVTVSPSDRVVQSAGVGMGMGIGMEIKAPRRVEREELEREVALGAQAGGSSSAGVGLQRGRSLEREKGVQGYGQSQAYQPVPQQQPQKQSPIQLQSKRTSSSIDVPSAPRSVFDSYVPLQTPGAGPSGIQRLSHLAPTTAGTSSSTSSNTPAGTSTPVAAPRPRPVASPSIVQQSPGNSPATTAGPFNTTLSPSPSIHRQHEIDKSPLRSALKNSGTGSGSGSSRSPSPDKVLSHRSQSPLKSALKNSAGGSSSNVSLPVGAVGHLGVVGPGGAGVGRTPSPLRLGVAAGSGAGSKPPAPSTMEVVVQSATAAASPGTPLDEDSRRFSVGTTTTTDDDGEYETADEEEGHHLGLGGRDGPGPSESTRVDVNPLIPISGSGSRAANNAAPWQPNGHAYPITAPSPAPSPAQAVVLSAQTSEEGSGAGSSVANGDAAGGGQLPKRRKSVRVSLQPTFTPTPPAIEYSDEEEAAEARAPWGGRVRGEELEERSRAGGAGSGYGLGASPEKKGKKGHGQRRGAATTSSSALVPDMWEDSSEEDVEYSRARKLLNRLSRKKDRHHKS